jgi:hypothetical protein
VPGNRSPECRGGECVPGNRSPEKGQSQGLVQGRNESRPVGSRAGGFESRSARGISGEGPNADPASPAGAKGPAAGGRETAIGKRGRSPPPLQPIISREDIDGLAAHLLGKIQAQVADEVSACARWYRETYDEPWKTKVQAQLIDLLRLDAEADPELPGSPPRTSPLKAPAESRPHLPMESSSTDAEPEPHVRREKPVRRGPGIVPARGPEMTSGRSAAFKRLDALYSKSQGTMGTYPKTPAPGSEESESSSGRRALTQSTQKSG